jgi:hypothetical protein
MCEWVRSAEVRSTLASAAGARSTSCFLDTASGATGTDLAHLEEQGFIVVDVCCGATVEVVAALALS